MIGMRWFACVAALGFLLLPSARPVGLAEGAVCGEASLAAFGQEKKVDEGEEEVEEEEEDEDEDEEDTEKPKVSERQKQVLALFNATRKGFLGDRIVLEYDFETRNEDLVLDWLEGLDSSLKSRIHWATRAEMEYIEVDSTTRRTIYLADGAIVLSDFGRWTHKAVFLPDLKIEVDLINVAHPRAGTVLGPAFYSPKKKTALCASNGSQPVCLKGATIVGAPPNADKPAALKLLQKLGYSYNGKVLEISRNGKKVCDTAQTPKVTEGFDVGHAAMAWTGSVKCFLASVTITGRLDPDWVSKVLGEKGDPKKDAKKDSRK